MVNNAFIAGKAENASDTDSDYSDTEDTVNSDSNYEVMDSALKLSVLLFSMCMIYITFISELQVSCYWCILMTALAKWRAHLWPEVARWASPSTVGLV